MSPKFTTETTPETQMSIQIYQLVLGSAMISHQSPNVYRPSLDNTDVTLSSTNPDSSQRDGVGRSRH